MPSPVSLQRRVRRARGACWRRSAASCPLAVASNGPADVVDALLRRTGLRRHVAALVSAEPTTRAEALPARLPGGLPFEDSLLGATAARAAGLLPIAVPTDRDVRIETDLTIARLHDPRVLSLFGLGRATNVKIS